MRTINEKDLKKLRIKGRATETNGSRIKSVKPKKEIKESKKPIDTLQTKALEKIGDEIASVVKAADNNVGVLLTLIRKLEAPAQIKKMTVVRDEEGFIKEIIPIRD